MLSHCVPRFQPRRCQQEILERILGEKRDEDKWYVVSPPGSGKTILGLFVAVRLNVPTLVLAPNTAIQHQWVAKSRFFLPEEGDHEPIAGVDPDEGRPITVLTYQALAQTSDLPDEQRQAILADWVAERAELGDTEQEARDWLAAYENQNPERFNTSLLRRWKARRLGGGDAAEELVSASALATMAAFRDRGVRLVIFDECHHLVGYWAQVAAALLNALDRPNILGLTATPPHADNLSDREVELHTQLLHKIDYSIPTPAVVREGHLAPYQDLVYFARPTQTEMAFIGRCSTNLQDVLRSVEEHDGTTLSHWLYTELEEITATNLTGVLRRRGAFVTAASRYLARHHKPLPATLRAMTFGDGELELEELADLVGRYASRCLLVSPNPIDRRRYGELSRSLQPLGYRLTEKGLRRQQSTVSRVLALSQAKMQALRQILRTELRHHADAQALIITDFERSNATIATEVEHLLTSESGGAIAAMRALTHDPETDRLDPILVTGQTVLVDDDLLPAFQKATDEWIREHGLHAEIVASPEDGFFRIHGSGPDWNTRNYVAMITHFFETGLTRCLVGTRGLLGEGWDSLCADTLVDLTTAATAMTVNQLRGRAIRLNPARPRKLANIWDVVCLAPEFENGLSDYHRFARKHRRYYGLCDDGAIEYGLGHIHPALTEAGPEDVALNAHVLNAEMLGRCARRAEVYERWAVGAPYENRHVPSLEVKCRDLCAGKPELGTPGPQVVGLELSASATLQAVCQAVFEGLQAIGRLRDPKGQIRIRSRTDAYARLLLESEVEEDMRLFATCMAELFQAVDRQRYIIPRYEKVMTDTWLSRLLPGVMRRYVARQRTQLAVYHPLPEVFGKSKDNAEAFSDAWNRHVSSGRAVFAQRGKGEETLVAHRDRSRDVMAARAKLRSVWR